MELPSDDSRNCLVKAQQSDATQVLDKGLEIKLIENITFVCKDAWLVIPKPLQMHAGMWYHHYLQHPRHTRLKETMNAAIYRKGIIHGNEYVSTILHNQ